MEAGGELSLTSWIRSSRTGWKIRTVARLISDGTEPFIWKVDCKNTLILEFWKVPYYKFQDGKADFYLGQHNVSVFLSVQFVG